VWHAFADRIANRVLRAGLAVASVALLGAAVVLLYLEVGRPDAVTANAPSSAEPHAGAATAAASGKASSMEQSAAALAARLARQGGSRDDWQLLAQSYDFLGRPAEAAKAREHLGGDTAASAAPAAAPDAKELERRTAQNPADASAWLALANLERQRREFPAARDAYRRVIKLKAMSADAWADYADTMGTFADGKLAGEPARAIEQALALDPRHTKALWLKASLAHEEHHYAEALKVWKTLRASMPADSPDLAVIDGNIAESAQLAGLPVPAAPVAAPPVIATSVGSEVTGTVSIDGKLLGRVAPGATLFIYAKAADSPGPPLAVLRTVAGAWPVRFRLDDSMAMIPSRRLSSFDRIIVEARVSSSGQATPTAGDLFVISPVVRAHDAKALKLVISQEVS
ncbi:MAG: tetratricopeptide repeat protein, partial [Steroidobacteraceae bacterium]